jgi:hypothetical protein
MEGTLKEISKLAGMIGSRTRLLILGVMLPGFIISCEIGVFLAAQDSGVTNRMVVWAEKVFQSPIVSITLAVLLLLAVSYLLGYLSREFTFALSTAWLRRGWPPTRRAGPILGQLRTVYGAAPIDTVINRHTVFDLVNHENDTAVRALPRPTDFYIREYCKLWLRMKTPALTTEHMEVEINLVMGLVFPVILAVVPCVLLLPNLIGLTLTVVTVVIVILVDLRFFYTINSVRCQETEEALLNFLFAHWTGLAEAAPGKAPAQSTNSSAGPRCEAEPDDEPKSEDSAGFE